jgi:hypothetical protein
MSVLFVPKMAPKQVKVAVRGADEQKELRRAMHLAASCTVALHQL